MTAAALTSLRALSRGFAVPDDACTTYRALYEDLAFVFTFSRATLAPDDQPVPGEPFVFTQFAGEPQCFLTETELKEELLHAGFEKDPPGPLTEYNRPVAGRTLTRSGPVILEATFRAVRRS